MRIIVIGAGFVGAPLCQILAKGGHDVVPVTRGGGDGSVAGDVSDRDSVAALGEADVVVHCASSGRGGDRLARYRAVYLEGCRNVLAALDPGRLVFVSSSSVYGQTDGSLVGETAETVPSTKTSGVLLEAEAEVLAAGGAVARLAGIYGAGRSYLLKKFLEGTAQIDGEASDAPGRWINQIHKNDAASAIAWLVGAGVGGVYNVADDRPLSQRECYVEFVRRFGGALPPVQPPELGKARGWSDKRVSNAKLREAGWAPEFGSYFDALDGDAALVPSIREQLSAPAAE